MLSENSASDFDDSYPSQAQDDGLDDREDSKEGFLTWSKT